MPLFEFQGVAPTIDPDAWVAETATLIGDVRLGPGVSIWYGAVLRADVGPIIIGAGTNVQDNSVLHVRTGSRLDIGASTTIAHGCIVHGRSIGDGSLVGNGAVLLDDSVIGSGAFIAAGSLVTPGTEIPDGALAKGSPAKVTGAVEPGGTAAGILERNAPGYQELARAHREGVRRIG
ncbi:gamma carbonic anhydrase family protein [Nocardioides sp. ChNu-153]|uniref:gamma carbonic anhydrase family protein n=1 Tax=unclassified Nocardioides TaxID=2615069 RepID=UPI0024059A9A|nr:MULTISPECIES: gamma carbonic anhydrase family protein [unclassified Nocardioides]MDF9714921.1 gamma carbonic anhydrase family protein [Nocardioides sp. ChNu-99]MDN7123078.1 gamma carbonic anhydrase family protein [Nocardioides sp. ChNu-153]